MGTDHIVARRRDASRYACTQSPNKDMSTLTWDDICKLTETACRKVFQESHGAGSEVTLHVINSTWPGRSKELADVTYHLSLDRRLATMPDPSKASCTHIPPLTPSPPADAPDLSVFGSNKAGPVSSLTRSR